jgi:hypothetical protein
VDGLRKDKSTPEGGLLSKEYLIVAGVGLLLGLISSMWI